MILYKTEKIIFQIGGPRIKGNNLIKLGFHASANDYATNVVISTDRELGKVFKQVVEFLLSLGIDSTDLALLFTPTDFITSAVILNSYRYPVVKSLISHASTKD